MSMVHVRKLASAVRKHHLVGPIVRAPFVLARRSGVALPPRLYQHLWFDGPIRVTLPSGGSFAMHNYGDVIENSYYWAGILGHEPECVAPWIELSRRSRVVLDIGANTGAYALISCAANPTVTVHAFEPVERVAAKLRRNARMNPSFGIEVHQLAVSDASGTAVLSDPGGGNCYSASLDSEFLSGPTVQYDVSVVAIDDFVEQHALTNVDLVKIDVEGIEGQVLRGMALTLEKYRPALLVEYLVRQRGALQQRVSALVDSGYVLFHLERDAPVRAASVGPSAESKNVMLVPEERLRQLSHVFP